MSHWLCQSLARMRAPFGGGKIDRELHAEMPAHLEMAITENVQKGMNPEEACHAARVRFGGQQQAMEEHRDARGLPMLEVIRQDLRYKFQILRRDGAFALIAILILAVGIGANIAVGTVVDTLRLHALPFAHAVQLTSASGNHRVGGPSALSDNVEFLEER